MKMLRLSRSLLSASRRAPPIRNYELLDAATFADESMSVVPDLQPLPRTSSTSTLAPQLQKDTSTSSSPFSTALAFEEVEEVAEPDVPSDALETRPYTLPQMLAFLRLQCKRSTLPGQRGFYRGQIDLLTRAVVYPGVYGEADEALVRDMKRHSLKAGSSWGSHQRDYFGNVQYAKASDYPSPDFQFAHVWTKHWSPGKPFKNRIECGAPHRQMPSKKYAR